MLIFEGPDGGGKSSTIEVFAPAVQLEVIHQGGPMKTIQIFAQRMDRFFMRPHRIFDRCPAISEFIYGTRLRKRCLVSESMIWKYLQALSKYDPIVIFCRPSDQTLLSFAEKLVVKDHKPPKHVELVKENILKIAHMYDDVMMTLPILGIKVLPYNRDHHQPKDLVNVWNKHNKPS